MKPSHVYSTTAEVKIMANRKKAKKQGRPSVDADVLQRLVSGAVSSALCDLDADK